MTDQQQGDQQTGDQQQDERQQGDQRQGEQAQDVDTSDLWEADDARKRDADTGLDGASAEEIEEERRRRLAPENRPENAEVDNTDRDFDVEKGMFTDEEGYEDAPKQFPPLGEGGA